jgi:acyl-CoA thioester hydrolase
MLEAETKIRVRYGETDQMGYAYYGIYAQYYEVGRVETMRRLGFSYKDVEDRGILMPVADFSISYKKPAFYDDELTLVTALRQRPGPVRLCFDYTCLNQHGTLLNTGQVTLVTLDKKTGKMCRLPDWFEAALDRFFPR